ncbi:hypothetical protein [Streptomyces avicenniae]|uniref:hypothetical protein n=1 Tax=Streptomyces avicenniae TaxID=500153 RepID=UPI00069A98F4|nr:hypothetical protein [Streptomyces avicenniae]
MPSSASGDRYTISIGGDASGPVVAGHDITVGGRASDEQDAGPGPAQTTTAREHGTAYTVMEGELHVHHDHSARPPEEEG